MVFKCQEDNFPKEAHGIGWLNDTEVLQVLRRGDEALHFTHDQLEVALKIDWPQRFDHMQQHSGQHFLSAILEKEHDLPTTSWWLGAEESYELDSTTMQKHTLEMVVGQAIPVSVKFCKANNPDSDEVCKIIQSSLRAFLGENDLGTLKVDKYSSPSSYIINN